MTSPTSGPCEPWTTPDEVRRCCAGLDPSFDLTDAIWWASVILWRKSGRRFHGVCERTVYPCMGDNCGCCAGVWPGSNTAADWRWAFAGYSGGYSGPAGAWVYPVDGGFVNVGLCDRRCRLPCVQLPGPIVEVTEVVVDGVTLDPGVYRVTGFDRLCRVDGGFWPCSNDLTCLPQDTIVELTVDASAGVFGLEVTVGGVAASVAAVPFNVSAAALQTLLETLPNVGVGNVTVSGGPGGPGGGSPYVVSFASALGSVAMGTDSSGLTGVSASTSVQQLGCTGEGSWQVTYRFGREIPADARWMASLLACQVALARCGGESCLPQRLKEITRQGVQMAFADPLEFLDKGEVGIYEIDLWLRDVNPARIARRASVHRADASPRATRFT